MASELAQAIRKVNERELDANEAALAKSFPPPPQVSPEAQQRLIPFVQWAEAQRVRALPARPTTVAAYVQYQQDQGVKRQTIAERLEAISQLHFAASMANPCATPVVRITTAASTIEPPRSWTKDEQQLFTGLPVEIQAVVARREHDREKVMRRAQNEAAEAKRLMAVAAKKPANTTNEKDVREHGQQK
jgi:hypothetical protein